MCGSASDWIDSTVIVQTASILNVNRCVCAILLLIHLQKTCFGVFTVSGVDPGWGGQVK